MIRTIELVESASPLKQGHVFRFDELYNSPYGCDFAVILTADCDLSQEKHYGQVLLCPVVPIRAYLAEAWSRRRAQKARATAIGKIRKALMDAPQLRGSGDVSDEMLELLVSSETVARELVNSIDALPLKISDEILKHVRVCIACTNDSPSPLEALINAVAARDSCAREDARSKVISEFRAEMKLDSAEIVVTNDEFEGRDAARAVLLRCPFSVPVGDLLCGGNDSVRRVGKFADPVKYLVAQKFGFLFSRFGMPEVLESERDFAVELEIF